MAAFSFIASAISADGTETDSKSTISTLNVQSGDLLVVNVFFVGLDTTCAVSDGGSISLGMETHFAGSEYNLIAGSVVAGSANSTATFTATLGAVREYVTIEVLQFRATGYTIAKDDDMATGNDYSSALESGPVTTTEQQGLAVAAIYAQQDPTSEAIGGQTPTVVAGPANPAYGEMMYYILDAETFSNDIATASFVSSNLWFVTLLTFKATGGGDAITWTPHIHRTMVFA